MRSTYQYKTTLAYSLIVTILLSVIGLSAFLLYKLYPITKLVITNKGEAACDCASHASYFASHPIVGSMVMFTFAVTTAYLLFIVFNLVMGAICTRRFVSNISSRMVKSSTKLTEAARSINLLGKVVEVQQSKSEIFCYGFFAPNICITSKLVQRVSKNQLRAILLHEKNHLASHDPLKIFIINVVKKSLPFFPGLKKLINQFEIGLELSADERATNNFREVKSLGKALLKIAEENQGHHSDISKQFQDVAVTYLGVTEARIDRLLNMSSFSHFTMFKPMVGIGVLLIASLFIVIFSSNVLIVKAGQMDGVSDSLTCHLVPEGGVHTIPQSSGCEMNTAMSCFTSSTELDYCK